MTTPADSNGSDPLDAVVADYLQLAEAGTPVDRDALLAAHPDEPERALLKHLIITRKRTESVEDEDEQAP